MANHKELKKISKSRMRASEILIKHKDYDGAYYLMGYALERALKAIICKRLNLSQYPDKYRGDKGDSQEKVNIFKTHNFDILLTLSGLESDFTLIAPERRAENWSECTKWNTQIRYEPVGTRSEADAKRMYEALIEKPEGIITWIKKHNKW